MLVQQALDEDCPWGDITSDLTIAPSTRAVASMVARQFGVCSGVELAKQVFVAVDPSLEVSVNIGAGQAFGKGDTLLQVTGSARAILKAERVALNFAQHLCAVATITSQHVQLVSHTKARIVDTRKTTPGVREWEKKAVVDGGGFNHRFSLSDAVLVKDNHIAIAGGIEALGDLRTRLPHVMHIEIEVDSPDMIAGALKAGADTVLCDNFSLEDLRSAVALIDGRALVEASGGITLDSVALVAETGVDIISVGALTHSAPAVDLGLDIETQ